MQDPFTYSMSQDIYMQYIWTNFNTREREGIKINERENIQYNFIHTASYEI